MAPGPTRVPLARARVVAEVPEDARDRQRHGARELGRVPIESVDDAECVAVEGAVRAAVAEQACEQPDVLSDERDELRTRPTDVS